MAADTRRQVRRNDLEINGLKPSGRFGECAPGRGSTVFPIAMRAGRCRNGRI